MTAVVGTDIAAPHPLRALATAEFRQFLRNKTLLFMGIVFPVGMPLLVYFLELRSGPPTTFRVNNAVEMFALCAMLLLQYYSVLSMVTTRRSEGVLKRLRTGEATDLQILTAPAIPGAVITAAGTAMVAAALYGSGGPLPVNPLMMLFALITGTLIFTVLALATTAMTKNAEAAQITSMPLMIVTMLGMVGLRSVLPDRLARIADWTPFAAVSDLLRLGQSGLAPGAPVDARGGGTVLSFAETFGAAGRPVATLVAWTVISLVAARLWFRWDDRG